MSVFEYFYLSRSLLDFFILVQLYSNQGVSCRNIGQEQLRVKQSFSARMTIKNSLFGFNSNGLLNHGKEGKTRYYVIQCRFSKFLIQLCIKKRFFWGSVQKYYYYVQKYCLFWGSCRNITDLGPGGPWILVQGHFWGPWRNIDFSEKYSPLVTWYTLVRSCQWKTLRKMCFRFASFHQK